MVSSLRQRMIGHGVAAGLDADLGIAQVAGRIGRPVVARQLPGTDPGVAVAQAVYMTLLAWIVSVLFFQIMTAGSIFWISVAVMLFFAVIASFFAAGRIINRKQDHGLQFHH